MPSGYCLGGVTESAISGFSRLQSLNFEVQAICSNPLQPQTRRVDDNRPIRCQDLYISDISFNIVID